MSVSILLVVFTVLAVRSPSESTWLHVASSSGGGALHVGVVGCT